MAEELLRKISGDRFSAESAGIEPGTLNPLVVDVLKEEGINIAGKKTNAVADKLKSGGRYDFVITVCDETSAERCPVFPGIHQRLHWSFPDPSGFKGTDAEKIKLIRQVKEEIKVKLNEWLKAAVK